MKAIFAPVDFSAASLNALSFAAELSKRTSARLFVINIMGKEESEKETKSKLIALQADLKNSFGSDFDFEEILAKGNFITTLIDLISANKPDLIVMGTKGASGLKKIIVGSNTMKVIANTKLPVLVIPELARFDNFFMKGKSRVVLATDLEILENEKALSILKEIAMLIIDPKIRVLSIRPKNTILPDYKIMERDFLLSYFSPEIESERVTVFSSNVIDGIKFYLDKNEDSGLLAMIARDSDGLFEKHYTREMAAHTALPLLVMHDAKI